jgi:hypothetical protein
MSRKWKKVRKPCWCALCYQCKKRLVKERAEQVRAMQRFTRVCNRSQTMSRGEWLDYFARGIYALELAWAATGRPVWAG